MKYTVLGVSSGLGVSLYPFKKHVIGNIEGRSIFHGSYYNQWELNFGKIPLFREIPKSKLKVDVMISSPDCGSGSILRYSRSKELGNHKNNNSLLMFFEGVGKYNPDFFLFENLDGLFKSFPKEDFKELLKDYRLIIHIAPVSNWGNSQINRKRLVVIGIRRDLPKKIDRYFKLPQYGDQVKNCRELYGDLSKAHGNKLSCNVREDIQEVISIHARRRMSLHEIHRQWYNWPNAKRWKSPGYSFSTAPGVYRNLLDSFPATARKANRQFDHNGLTLTPRQLARVQGVPDDFKLFYDDTRPKYSINKSRCTVTKTPPMEISIWFKRKLEKALKHIAE